MTDRDLIYLPEVDKWIDRKDASGVPSKLSHICECGKPIGYGIDHELCPFTKEDPDDRRCDKCDRYRCDCD